MAVQTQSRRRFHFVLVERMKPETTDRREFELVDAGARSHAARIAHEARRKSALTKKAIHAMKQEPDEAEPAWAYSPSSTATQMSNSFLDPFVQLPMDLTLEERNLLHDCELLPASHRLTELTLSRSDRCTRGSIPNRPQVGFLPCARHDAGIHSHQRDMVELGNSPDAAPKDRPPRT